MQISVPDSGSTISKTLQVDRSLVLIGANGAGKSRMGVAIERAHASTTRRISAHKILTIPQDITLVPLEIAEGALDFGNIQTARIAQQNPLNLYGFREGSRWQGGSGIEKPLDDFTALLSLFFARMRIYNDDYVRAVDDHVHRNGPDAPTLAKTPSPSERLQTIWSKLLPHVNISLLNEKVTAAVGSSSFPAGRMSDGERVIFYMCAHVILAAPNSMLIIDEPELHIHRSLVSTLWSLLEDERPDCTFVYITQDLEFAGSRVGSRVLWIRSYDGNEWLWEEVRANEELPIALKLEILGSRRRTFFVEGVKGGLDAQIYSVLFPEVSVKPQGGCKEVIQLVRAAANDELAGGLSIEGIVDRDFRSEAEITSLRDDHIHVLNVAEVENLYCLPEIISAVARRFYAADETAALSSEAKAYSLIRAEFAKDLTTQVVKKSSAEIRNQLGMFSIQGPISLSGLQSQFTTYVSSLTPSTIFQRFLDEYTFVKDSGNVKDMLKLLNRKGLYRQVANALGVTHELYVNNALHLLQNDDVLRQSVLTYIS